ncbi:MAG: chromate efflux transporter [Litoricolaceae bacterium]|nr:chromate efflux transporter [Litorivicinaceae bacterium]
MTANFTRILFQFLWLGCTSFGGPTAHIGIFRRQFVEKEKRFSEEEYATLVALCQMIPGPASSQVGMGLGYQIGGFSGSLAAWVGFTLPSAILMYLGALWILEDGSLTGGWFVVAMKLVAVGIVTQAVLGMWSQLCVTRETKLVALIAAVIFYSAPVAFTQVGLIVAALIAGYVSQPIEAPKVSVKPRYWKVAMWGLLICAVGVGASGLVASDNAWISMIAGHYSSGALVFGGGHVVLPLLEAEFVPPLQVDTFLAGYGFAQAMPGPLFTLASYLGPILIPESTLLAAVVATAAIFLPGAIVLLVALSIGQQLMHWKSRLVFVNAVVVGLLFAILVNPIFTEAVDSEVTTALAVLSLIVAVALKRSPLELVAIMIGATFLVDQLGWI